MRFSHVGVDKDGKPILRQWSPEEEARRDAEDAAHAASTAAPAVPPRNPIAEIDALKAEIEKLKAAK